MSRFKKLSQTIWHCQYHITWTPKYRNRILTGNIAELVEHWIRAYSDQLKCEIVELNVQIDHVHLISMVPPNREQTKELPDFASQSDEPFLNDWAKGLLKKRF